MPPGCSEVVDRGTIQVPGFAAIDAALRGT